MRILNRSPFQNRKCGQYRVENKADEATFYIYDEISYWGISADQFVKDLNASKASTVHIRINSPGGSVFDGTAIYNAIKQHKATTITHVDGLAASISSIIALAGDEVRMADNTFLMIHNPWSIVIGDAQAMREEADLLEKVSNTTIAAVYMAKSGKEKEEILQKMSDETWFTAQEAKEYGLVDVIDEVPDEAKDVKNILFDLEIFANVPDALKKLQNTTPSPREIEKALRDVGCSNSMAKAIIANGLKHREDGEPEQINKKEAFQTKDRVTQLLIRAERVSPERKN